MSMGDAGLHPAVRQFLATLPPDATLRRYAAVVDALNARLAQLRHAESDAVAWLAEIDLALREADTEARQQLLDQRAQRTAARGALSEEIAAVTTQRVVAYLRWLARLHALAIAEAAQVETALAALGAEQGGRARALQAQRTRARQIAGLARHQAQWYGTDVRLEAPETWTEAAARAGRLQQVRIEETFPQDELE